MVTDASRQCEAMFESTLVQIVEKNAADAARLAAVLEEKIIVTPGLEPGMVVVAERRQRRPTGSVKVSRVLLEAVIRREIHAAAEPPDRLRFGLARKRGEESQVHVDRWHMRIARMQHRRHSHDLERPPGKLRPRHARRRGQPLTLDVRKVDAATLEHPALFQDAAGAAATFDSLPFVATKSHSVQGLEPADDARLQAGEVTVRARQVLNEVHDGLRRFA